MLKKLSSLLGVALLLSACATTPQAPPTPAQPAQPQPVPERKLKIGLALGGGAAKGFAHIGVIKVLESAGIKPDIVTGTSAGAVVGAIYASGVSPYELQLRALKLDESTLTDYTVSTSGFIKGEKLGAFVNQQVGGKKLEQLKIPFGAVATEFATGKRVVFKSGDTGTAVRASASIPNVFQPVSIGGKRYVDGGLVSPVPVIAAREMGADFIIAVDISARPSGGKGTGGFFSILDQSLNIMNLSALQSELKQADIIMRPQVGHIGAAGFDERNVAILEGEKVARQALPLIQRNLAAKQQALARGS